MNLKRTLLVLAIGFGLLGCRDTNADPGIGVPEGIETYVTLSIYMPGVQKAGRDLPEDYNPDGFYEGNDAVRTLDVYMLSASGTIEAKRFNVNDLSTNGNIVSPNQPFRTTSGSKTVYVVLNDPNPLETSITSEDTLVPTTGLAGRTTIGGVEYDLITMTGKTDGPVTILPDIPVTGVTAGENHVAVTVERVASRVIVTTTASPELILEDGTLIGTVSNVTYSVAQGTKMIHWIAQPNYVSYGYDYVPALGEYVGEADTYYDYSDLSTPSPIPAKPASADGYKSLVGKFLFENTHFSSRDRNLTGYRKGNTAYVLVKAVFTPEPDQIADGGTLTNGTFYYGQSDGKFYSSITAAQEGFTNQKVSAYINGEMLNYAWLNPDIKADPLNSPVVRNNIYHINITGFKRLAYNWNPLYPEDPDTGSPANPDPKPINPYEPESPIDPIDPLSPEQTYMTVDVDVLDWYVHSYDIEF